MLILIDTNVPMYVWGREHPLKPPCVEVLGLAAVHRSAFISDAEVLQEMLHRFRALRRWDDVWDSFRDFVELMSGRIEPLLPQDVLHAGELASRYPSLSARDLVHVAVAMRADATHIVSADGAFDVIEEVVRLDPLKITGWRELVTGA